jgi:hypothetical protein
MRFNISKTKEMVFDFSRQRRSHPSLILNGTEVEQVSEAKLLGVIVQSNLKWNAHIKMMVQKANKRLYLLRLCSRAGVSSLDLVMIYTSLVRSVMEYCCIVWHSSLPKYLHDELERVQKRALAIIFPNYDYSESLKVSKLCTLYERREVQCRKLFCAMAKPTHKLHHLLPDPRQLNYDIRRPTTLPNLRASTTRYHKTFVPYAIRQYQ